MSILPITWKLNLESRFSHPHPARHHRFLDCLVSAFPFAMVQADANDKISAEETAVLPPTGSAKKPTVLIIDDQKTVREAIADILELKNLGTLLAGGGAEGIKLYVQQQTAVRLVVLDLSMPGMNGEETFRRLRQISPSLGVLFTSGYDKMSLANELPTDENVDFLQKPFQFNDLVSKVESLLAKSID